MKIRILGLAIGAGALAIWGTVGCEQPQIDCRVLHGDFSAKYTLLSGGMECSGKKGDIIGLQSYYAASSDRKTVDLSRSIISIGTGDLPGLIDEAATYGDDSTVVKADSYGSQDFVGTEPNDKDICAAKDVLTAEVSTNAIPAVPDDPNTMDDESYPGRPATDIKYEWRNVRLLVTPANPGNYMKAELTYTENGCTATYSVVAIAPAIPCDDTDDMGVRTPNDAYCNPVGVPLGSGISADLEPKCDPNTFFCVATKTDLIP